MLWMVVYKIKGQDGEQAAGPYSDHELEYQRQDIASYDKVYDVRVEPAEERKEKAMWEVVCPDGIVRKHLYRNWGDAESDANVFRRRGCALYAGPEEPPGCPGGPHTVREVRPKVQN